MQPKGRYSVLVPRMTIEDLARKSGCTTRNIRNYQTRGLLPSPTVVARTGYYDEGHLARLRLIANLQSRGYSLAAIADLTRAWEDGKDVGHLLGFETALAEPWDGEQPERIPVQVMLERFPEAATDRTLIERAIRLGLVVLEGDDVVVLHPRTLAIGADLVAAGVPLTVALDELDALVDDADRIAARFVLLFERHVWEPFQAAGQLPDVLPDVTAALKRMRPLATRAVAAVVEAAMDQRVSDAIADRLAQQGFASRRDATA